MTNHQSPITNHHTYLFSGGGTGGHLFPGLAVAEELRRRDPLTRIVFVGSGCDIECQIVNAHGYEHVVLPFEPSGALRRNPLRFAWNGWRSLRSALRLIDVERPVAVVGLGGFASVPVVWAASRRGVPTILLEQNVVAGRATRLLSRRASLVCLSFAETIRDLPRATRTCVTGNPVRREIAALHENENDGEAERTTSPTLLILGGSQGAAAVNEAVFHAVESLATELVGWTIIHQTGRADADRASALYDRLGLPHAVQPFFDDLPSLYARATLAVSRAGATTLAELACAGCPAILIPYPNSIRDHQRLNALAFERAGGALVVEQSLGSNETSQMLARNLSDLIHHSDRRREMSDAIRGLARPEAAREAALGIEQASCNSGQVFSLPDQDQGRRGNVLESRVE